MTAPGPDELVSPIEDVRYRPGVCDEVTSDLHEWIRDQHWNCRTWTDGPSTDHPAHDHPYSHRVLCVSGWIEFTAQDQTHRLTPGDALGLPSSVMHSATTAPETSTEYWLLQPS